MKRFFIWTVVIWSVILVMVAVCAPKVEAYGQATLQYDKGMAVYFVETENFRMDVNSQQKTEDMYAGKRVSFLKVQGQEAIVVSGNVSKENLLDKALNDKRRGYFIARLVAWCLLVVISILVVDVQKYAPVSV